MLPCTFWADTKLFAGQCVVGNFDCLSFCDAGLLHNAGSWPALFLMPHIATLDVAVAIKG